MSAKTLRSKKTLGKGRRLTEVEREAIASAPASVGTAELAKQFDTTINTITRYRNRGKLAAKAATASAKQPTATVTPITAAKRTRKAGSKAASKKTVKKTQSSSRLRIPINLTIEIDSSAFQNLFTARAVNG